MGLNIPGVGQGEVGKTGRIEKPGQPCSHIQPILQKMGTPHDLVFLQKCYPTRSPKRQSRAASIGGELCTD